MSTKMKKRLMIIGIEVVAAAIIVGIVFLVSELTKQNRIQPDITTEASAFVSSEADESESESERETTETETETETETSDPLALIDFSVDKIEIFSGETAKISLLNVPEDLLDTLEIVYESSDPQVATVDEQGVITGVSSGKTEISVTASDVKRTFTIQVHVALQGLSMYSQSLTLDLGTKQSMTVNKDPINTDEEVKYTWSSSNPAVASVDQEGLVTAIGAGSATITASYREFKATCQITVRIPVTGISISKTSITLTKGGSQTLSAAVSPGNTTEPKTVTWSSGNTKVATVSADGTVTAVGAGTCKITANHEMVGASCDVTVLSPMTGIVIDQTNSQIGVGYETQLSVTFLPQDTTDEKTLSWTSSDTGVVSVDGSGKISAISEGEAVITASCNGFTAEATVLAVSLEGVESVSLSASSHTFSSVGESTVLAASISPSTILVSPLWTSGNPSVASVNSEGKVTAVGVGTTVITASVGAASASCTVTVNAASKVVVLDPGHSARFTGAYYNGVKEHDITLSVANYCKQYLESHYAGVKVYLTRSNDQPLASTLAADLEQRAVIAQNVNADILVSIHFNASTGHNATGCLAFVSQQPNVAAQSQALAGRILNHLAGLGLTNNGTRATQSTTKFDAYGNPLDYYAINRHAANRGIPGIIVEQCFMDTEFAYYNSQEALNRLGVANAKGIAGYLGLPAK